MAEKLKPFDISFWKPKTHIGKLVKKGEITDIDQIFEMGKPILEYEIVDALLPDLESETLLVKTTQRSTDSGRKMQFRVVVAVGDHKGHVGVGVGKSEEVRPAIEYAIKDAKKHIIPVKFGCGSWECQCGGKHSLPIKTTGKSGSVSITLKPAPKGLGLATNEVVKKVLTLAGLKDMWGFSRGYTANIYNTAMATIDALSQLNSMRYIDKGDS